jgi:hypothetical protein
MASAPLSFTICKVTSEGDFLPLATVEEAAFTGPQTTLFFGSSSNQASLAAARHTKIFRADPTAIYFKAVLENTNQIIGLAKWNLFSTAGPHFPWPTTGFAEDANTELLSWFFGQLDEKRNALMDQRERVKESGYLYMAILAVDPKYQRWVLGGNYLSGDWRRRIERGWSAGLRRIRRGNRCMRRWGGGRWGLRMWS